MNEIKIEKLINKTIKVKPAVYKRPCGVRELTKAQLVEIKARLKQQY